MDNTPNFSNRNWRLNPSEYIAGGTALSIGFFAMIIIAAGGHFVNANFDGVVDLHIGKVAPIWYQISEPVISWLIFSMLLYIAGQLFSTSSFRIIDVFGTQAFARIAILPAVPLSYFATKSLENSDLLQRLSNAKNTPPMLSSSDISSLVTMGLLSIPVLFFFIWMIMWMYKAYSTSCNIKGGKAIMSFIGALIIAEIISKVVLYMIGKCI